MSDKDKAYQYSQENDVSNRMIETLDADLLQELCSIEEKAFLAGCEYKQKQIDKLKSTLIYVFDWYGRFMSDTTIDKIIKAVEGK